MDKGGAEASKLNGSRIEWRVLKSTMTSVEANEVNDIGQMDRLRVAAVLLLESDIASEIPGFTVPAQERTRVKSAAILATAAYMLQCRDFSEVTVEEIAAGAACSVPSIYARFQNKEALLPAIHLLLIEAIRQRLNKELTKDRFKGESLEFFCRTFVGIIDDYFHDNHNFIRALIIGEVDLVHVDIKNLMPALVDRLIGLIEILGQPKPLIEKIDVFFALDMLFAILRDCAVVPSFEQTRDLDALTSIFLISMTSNIRSRAQTSRSPLSRPTRRLKQVKNPFL